MPKISAGLLMYRWKHRQLQVLLVHPGGPLFQNKDAGAWSIPKGEINVGEEPLDAAQREFLEEVGSSASGPFIQLETIRQKGGKVVHAWAFAGDLEPSNFKSNTFKMEWPPKSGKQVEFAEVDKADFFPLADARGRINPAQMVWLNQLETIVERATDADAE